MRTAAALSGLSCKEVNAIVFLIFEPVLMLLFLTYGAGKSTNTKNLVTNTKGEKV